MLCNLPLFGHVVKCDLLLYLGQIMNPICHSMFQKFHVSVCTHHLPVVDLIVPSWLLTDVIVIGVSHSSVTGRHRQTCLSLCR